MSTVTLTEQPKTSQIYTSAALGALPFLGSKSKTVPSTVFELKGLRVDQDNLAGYCRATGLRFGDQLPITYPFTLVFPTVMKLMVSKGFPFAAIGSVHAENVIEQFRGISASEPLDIRVHAENLREHRKGLLVDLISEVKVGRELVWKQTSSFLSLQKTSLSGGPRETPPADEVPPPRPAPCASISGSSAGTRPSPETATRSTYPRSAQRLSASRRPSHTECGVLQRYCKRSKAASRRP